MQVKHHVTGSKQRGTTGRTNKGRVSQGIAKQTLDSRAGRSNTGADNKGQEDPRQANLQDNRGRQTGAWIASHQAPDICQGQRGTAEE